MKYIDRLEEYRERIAGIDKKLFLLFSGERDIILWM